MNGYGDRCEAFEFHWTRHALQRVRQRGIQLDQIGAFMSICDRARPVGGQCTALTLSCQALAEAKAEGRDASLLDTVRRLVVVIADNGDVVTVAKQYAGHRGRIYRRGWK